MSNIIVRRASVCYKCLMPLLLTMLLSLNCLLAQAAAPTVVLLTSLKSPKIWYRPATWDLNNQLEKNFRRSFASSGYRLKVIHDASASDLEQTLRAPENIGVFWVSHAAAGDDNVDTTLGRDDVILDVYGENVKDIFQVIHPNLRYLAVIGCESESVFEGFKKSGTYINNPNLLFTYFNKPVDALRSLNYALNQWSILLDNESFNEDADCYVDIPKIESNPKLLTEAPRNCLEVQSGIDMKIKRTIDSNADITTMTPVMIYLGDHFLTILPQAHPGKTQEKNIFIPNDILQAELKAAGGNLTITASSGFDGLPSVKPDFGHFSFNSALGDWDLFVDKKGKAVGVTSNLFTHHGPVNALAAWQLVQGLPLACQ